MDEHDTDSITINIPKPRKYIAKEVRKKSLQKRMTEKVKRKPSEASVSKYSIQGTKPEPVRAFKNDDLLYSYTLFFKLQNKLRHKQLLAIDIIEKYKINYTDLRKRLHVEDPADEVFALTDIDEEYFRTLNGRPLPEHTPIYKTLKTISSQLLRLKHEIGCRQDCVINIEVNYRQEKNMYDISLKRYKKHVKLFDAFISEDYKESMMCLKRWEDLKVLVNAKIIELRHLATEKFTIISKLIGLNYMYGLQQKYGRFLYYLSPPSWRAKHREFAHSVEIEAKGFDIGGSNEEDTFNVIFEKMRNECISGLIKPPLYFTECHNLMDRFESIEQQQLHHFTYVTHLAPHAKKLKDDLKLLKEIHTADSATVLFMIKQFENLLVYTQEQENQIRSNFFKVLDGLFYDSVGAADVLKLQVHLEFCYEKIFIDKPANMCIFTIAKALEDAYMSYTFKLDEVHSNKIKVATKQYIEHEKMKLKRAKIAARELRLFGRLERRLLRAFAPVASKETPTPAHTGYQHTKRRTHQLSKAFGQKSIQHDLTETQIEYLSLFTDWTNDDDPAKYIHFEENEETAFK